MMAAEAERQLPSREAWAAAGVVTLAVLVGLAFRGVSGETVADAVKDIGAALIPVLSALYAFRLISRQMDPAERLAKAGEAALADLQRRHADALSGPKASRDRYDPDNPAKAARYLFVQKGGEGRKAQLIPVFPLRYGVVEVRVSRTTMLLFGTTRDAAEERQKAAQASVRDAVLALLERDWRGAFEVPEHDGPGHPDVALVVDFDEESLGTTRYGKAVAAVAEAALGALQRACR